MRLLHYNILDGVQDDEARLAALLQWIAAQNADVVTLVELNGWDQDDRLARRAKACGYEYSYLFHQRSRYLLGVMSRQPIQVVREIHEGVWHGIAHLRLPEFDLILSHWAPFDRDCRMREAAICAELASKAQRPAVIVGDLNSHSPADRALCETFLTPANAQWALDFAAQQTLLDAGLIDLGAGEAPGWTTATALKPQEPRRRLDYVIANRAFVARYPGLRARAIHDPAVARLSDHYPVLCSP